MSVQAKEKKKVDHIRPLNDWVVVEPEEEKHRETAGGILIPVTVDKSKVTNMIGKVVGVGGGSEKKDVDFSMEIDVNVGDTVVYERGKGIPVKSGGIDCDLVRGYNLVGKLLDIQTEGMPGIWQHRTLHPFADRIFVEWLEGSETLAGGKLWKPQMMKSRTLIARVISMGENMPDHFKDQVEPGTVVLFDPNSIEAQLHNWRHEGKLYCIVKANDFIGIPAQDALDRIEYEGQDMTKNLEWGG